MQLNLPWDPGGTSRPCGNDGGGNWIPCGQKPEQVSAHRDHIPESTRQLSCCLLLLHLSTPPAPSLLLCFHFPLLSLIRDPARTLGLHFLQRCIHSFLCSFLAHSAASQIPSLPTPPSAWLLTRAYFTVAHIKQPDEGNTGRLFAFSEECDPSQGHIVCLCVFFSYNFGLKY